MGDLNLDEIAAQELLNEAKRGAARASVYGALGWQKCPLKPTNKVFLQNILLSTLSLKRKKDSNADSQQDSSRRKLYDDDFEDKSFRRHERTERSLQDERQTSVNFQDSDPLSKSASKLMKLENSSWRRNSRYSRSISMDDLHSVKKERKKKE